MVFTGEVRPQILDARNINTLNISMHAVTSDYKRKEQNGVPLSNSSLVMTSYSLQTTGS